MGTKDKFVLMDMCVAGNVSTKQVLSRTRKREVVVVRQAFMIFMVKHRKMTRVATGKLFERDHSTVIHALNMEKVIFNENPKLKEVYETSCLRY